MSAPIAFHRYRAPGASNEPERRVAPRAAVWLPIEIEFASHPRRLPATACDVGLGGVCVQTPGPFDLQRLWNFVQDRAIDLARFLRESSDLLGMAWEDVLAITLCTRLREIPAGSRLLGPVGGIPNSCTASAETAVQVLEVDRETMRFLEWAHPPVARTFAQRVVAAHVGRLAALVQRLARGSASRVGSAANPPQPPAA